MLPPIAKQVALSPGSIAALDNGSGYFHWMSGQYQQRWVLVLSLALMAFMSSTLALGQPTVRVQEVWPPSNAMDPIELALGESLYLVLNYDSDTALRLYATVSYEGGPRTAQTMAAPILPAGQGTTLIEISQDSPEAIDNISISFRSGNASTGTNILTYGVAAQWQKGPSARQDLPPRIRALTQELKALLEQANTPDESSPGPLWNLIIAVIVLSGPGSIAWLAWAASRHWTDYWRIMALAPLPVLVLLCLFIAARLAITPLDSFMWPFDLFVWAMGTAVYLVVLMTAKKAFNLADQGVKPPDI